MSTPMSLHRNEKFNQSKSDCANVLLYCADNPVMSVEQGTTFGLTKMLYQSVGGHDEIIGLRQRLQSSATLACIITQDQTVLTEREYDIILHGTAKERGLSTKNAHDKEVNTMVSVRPDVQIWPTYSMTTPRQMVWGNDRYIDSTPMDDLSWKERKKGRNNSQTNMLNGIDAQMGQKVLPNKCYDYVTSDVMNMATDKNEAMSVVSSRHSVSPSTASIESPELSSQHSPTQAEEPRSHRRKWQCFYCKKFFLCRSAYDNHERTHTGEKPFRCNVCGRCFGHQGNLKQHMHIHRDVKPHVCDVCGRGFTRSNRLRDHKRSHQYQLYMHTKVQWTTAQKVTADNRPELSPVSSNAFEESATSDENQETS